MRKNFKRFTLVVGWRWSKFTIGAEWSRGLVYIDLLWIYVGIEW